MLAKRMELSVHKTQNYHGHENTPMADTIDRLQYGNLIRLDLASQIELLARNPSYKHISTEDLERLLPVRFRNMLPENPVARRARALVYLLPLVNERVGGEP
jgi:hypothetical protein